MPTLIISFPKDRPIKSLVFNEKNVTVYYKGYDELMLLLYGEAQLSLDLITDHASPETSKEKYHDGKESHEDEGHVHYERADTKPLELSDVQQLGDYLVNLKLISKHEKEWVTSLFMKQAKAMEVDPIQEEVLGERKHVSKRM